jgi:DNA polymerase-3 subunit gamma/tau
MAYQVLARKWRPQDFSSVIGQDSIVTALRNAVSEGRVAQAYLFSGIRGVGKTSVARVLAKALNCENGPAPDPCNECQTCAEITAGSDLDVIEVDAATYSKVEQVRELSESLKYGPARDRYKIVVIDEIHRLSRQAFDALLKIVEEPPDHLVFIFATTEIDSVPATILSRCQEFHFRRVRPAVLTAHLRQLADREEIAASDTALRLVSRAGEGSVRDAVALLDQLATYGSGQIADEEAARILGGVDATVHFRLLSSIIDGIREEIAAVVEEIEAEGWDPRHVYAEFLAYCRDALHLALGAQAGDIELPEDDAERLAELASGAGYENLLRLLHQLLKSEPVVRRSEAGILAVEIAWLRAAELPKLSRIEEILASGAPPDSTPRKARQRPQAEPSSPPESKQAEPRIPGGGVRMQDFLVEVSRRRQPLAAHLQSAEKLEFVDGRLSIYTAPHDHWLATALARGNNRKILEESLASVWGEGTGWSLLESKADASPATTASAPADDPVLKHPIVQTALDIFGGTARASNRDDSQENP